MCHFLTIETVKLVWGPSHIFSKIKAMRLNNLSPRRGKDWIRQERGINNLILNEKSPWLPRGREWPLKKRRQ